MKASPEQIERGLAASYRLRDNGIPAEGIKPQTFTAAPSLHVRVIADAILALVPKRTRKPHTTHPG